MTIGTIVVLMLLFLPPSLRTSALGGGDDLGVSVVEWLTTLYASPEALASVISAFAVLMLALFIEESLKASDKVAVGTRRNIATFAFIGGIATVAIVGIAIAGVSIGRDAGAAIQILGSAASCCSSPLTSPPALSHLSRSRSRTLRGLPPTSPRRSPPSTCAPSYPLALSAECSGRWGHCAG